MKKDNLIADDRAVENASDAFGSPDAKLKEPVTHRSGVGIPRSGPKASIRSAYRMKRATCPAGRARMSVSTRESKNVTVQTTG